MVQPTALAWMMSLMLAPHSLVLVGNLAGSYQWMFFLWIVPVLGLYWLNARSALRVTARQSQSAGAILSSLLLASRWVTTVVLSTVLLVTAGFAFNEIFVYWFPNFAFAFILLGMLLTVQLTGDRTAGIAQLFFLSLVLAGLCTLVVIGLWNSSSWHTLVGHDDAMAASYPPYGMLLLFVGFDLVSNQLSDRKKRWTAGTVFRGLGTAAIVLALWALVSLMTVPTEKLSDSFIPHIITARNIAGETGRMIMGMVIISGSCAAVNGLLGAVAQSTSRTASRWSFSQPSGHGLLGKKAIWTLLSASAIGTMMASGAAGTEAIDVYARAGLLLWMIYYGAVHLAVLADDIRKTKKGYFKRTAWLEPSFGALTMVSAVVFLVFTDTDRALLVKFAWPLAGMVVFSIMVSVFFKRINPNTGVGGVR